MFIGKSMMVMFAFCSFIIISTVKKAVAAKNAIRPMSTIVDSTRPGVLGK